MIVCRVSLCIFAKKYTRLHFRKEGFRISITTCCFPIHFGMWVGVEPFFKGVNVLMLYP